MSREINRGAFIQNGKMTIATSDEKIQMSIYDFALKGKHNQYNTMAAGIAGAMIGIRKEKIRDAVQTFEEPRTPDGTGIDGKGVTFHQ